MRHWEPIIIENSRIPRILSYIAPISISAITLGFVVFSKDKMDERTRRHEIIHFHQFFETLFLGFALIYLYDYIVKFLKYRDGKQAYSHLRAEIEAYENDEDPNYMEKRKRYQWIWKCSECPWGLRCQCK